MLYYAIGPVVAFIISIKFTDYSTKKRSSEIKLLEAKVEQLERTLNDNDKAMFQKVMTTVVPVTKAVRELQTTVGVL